MRPTTGVFATWAVVAVAASVLATFTGHPFIGLLIAAVSLPLGIAGFVHAASPRVRGGLLSLFATVAGFGMAVVSFLGVIGSIVF